MSRPSVWNLIEQDIRERAMHQTWGHLAPEPKRIYPGFILFAWSEYGDVTPIQTDFGDLPDSPWFYSAMNHFIADKCVNGRLMRGGIFRFDGYCKMQKNGVIKFSGKVRPMRVTYRFAGKKR